MRKDVDKEEGSKSNLADNGVCWMQVRFESNLRDELSVDEDPRGSLQPENLYAFTRA